MTKDNDRIDAGLIAGWLRDIGCHPKPSKQNPEAEWEFTFDYPLGTSQGMLVLNPKNRPRALVIASDTRFSPEHIAAFHDRDDEAKADFLRDFIMTINREYIEYALQTEGGVHSCPTAFQLTATRFDDGLNLDSFQRSISSLHKAKLAAIMCVQHHLAPAEIGGNGHFEFRRTGGIQ